jgi:hypothetical protein
VTDVLNVFLSYKMPRPEDGDEKTNVAKEFPRVLSDASAGRIVAHYAGNFGAGKDWRTHLIGTIQKCDMFILLLYTGGEQQWEFCMLEAGLFRATHPDRELIVLHHQRTKTLVDIERSHRPRAQPYCNRTGSDFQWRRLDLNKFRPCPKFRI